MKNPQASRAALAMSLPLAILVAIASGLGALGEGTYSADRTHFATQGTGQDWVTLVVAVPALLLLALAAWRGSRRGLLLWHGVLMYLAYTYAIAAFMVQFNALFLVYTAAFGLATLALAASLPRSMRETPHSAFTKRWPRRTVVFALWAVAATFSLLWLSDIVPALANGTAPASLAESGTPTNGVEVLDLALVIPSAVIVGAWVLRSQVRGLVAATGILAFVCLLSLALVAMVAALVDAGLAESAAPAVAFATLAALAGALTGVAISHTWPVSTDEWAHDDV